MQAGSRDKMHRRLAAILAGDVVGYSRLMEADESGTAGVLREHRAAADPLVAKHGGRIVKTTGDGVLIEFASLAAGSSRRATIHDGLGQGVPLAGAAASATSAAFASSPICLAEMTKLTRAERQ